MAQAITNSTEKFAAMTEKKTLFDAKAEEYKELKAKVEGQVQERDARAAALKAEHEAVTVKMEALGKLGAEVEAQMAQATPRYTAAVEELKELSSNDLTRLVEQESPDQDIEKVMDSVMVLLGEATGW